MKESVTIYSETSCINADKLVKLMSKRNDTLQYKIRRDNLSEDQVKVNQKQFKELKNTFSAMKPFVAITF